MRFAKFDKETTKAAGFKDKRSKIGRRFDGTLRFDLAGKDKNELHDLVFKRDKWRCVDRPKKWNDIACYGPLEMSYWPPMSKSGGSDEMATCFTRCRKHHRILDANQVRWTKKEKP